MTNKTGEQERALDMPKGVSGEQVAKADLKHAVNRLICAQSEFVVASTKDDATRRQVMADIMFAAAADLVQIVHAAPTQPVSAEKPEQCAQPRCADPEAHCNGACHGVMPDGSPAGELMAVAEACVAQRCTIAMEDWLDSKGMMPAIQSATQQAEG